MTTTPLFDRLATEGTNGDYALLRLADDHRITVLIWPGADRAEEVFPHPGLVVPATEAWENQDDWEAWLTGGSHDEVLYLNVPVSAIRELIKQHGGEHAEQ